MKTKILTLFVLTAATIFACRKNNPNPPSKDPKTDSSGTDSSCHKPKDVHLRNGLLVYLPFDGNMADSSGNGNLTTPIGGASLTYDEHGYANRAFNGNGNGGRLLVTNNGSIKFDTAYSISVNYMVRDIRRQALVTLTNVVTSYGVSFILKTDPAYNGGDLVFGAVDSTITCSQNAATGTNIVAPNFVPQPESWYNTVCTYQKGTVKIYVNGALVATQASPIPKATLCPDSQFEVGGWWNNDPLSFYGKIDEVRLYNRVLNADEISVLARRFKE